MSNSSSLYSRLYEAYKKAHAEKTKQVLQAETNALWAVIKKSENIENAVNEEIKKLNCMTTRKKAKFLNFFSKIPSTSKACDKEISDVNQPMSQEKTLDINISEVNS